MSELSTLATQNRSINVTSCNGCRHFGITHNAARPYRCGAFGLLSRQHPARDIFNHSGEACHMRAVSAPRPFFIEREPS